MRTTFARLVVFGLVIVLFAGACGDEDEAGKDGGVSAAGSEENERFCEALTEAQAAAVAAFSGGPADDVESAFEEGRASAPDEVKEQFETVARILEEALETKQEPDFESEEFTSAEDTLDSFVVEKCGFETIEVKAVEYAFEGIPASIPAGTVVFDWENDGSEVHEMIVVRKKDESIATEDLLKMSDKEAQKKIQFINAVFGPPGQSEIETMILEPGQYLAVCFVPVGATSEEKARTAKGPPHVAKGMVAEFSVE